MPVTKQKQQTVAKSRKPFKWCVYVSIILVLVLAITVVSSYVLKMEHGDSETNQEHGGLTHQGPPEASAVDGTHSTSSANSIENMPMSDPSGGGNAANTTGKLLDDLKVRNQVPVIGVLSQVLRDYKRFTKDHHLHIAASYVKWLESAGAQVVPILLNQNDFYYEQMFKQTNGLLFPGGDNLLDPAKSTPMMVAARKLYKMAVESNEAGHFYPIWGTCLGLELLSVLSSEKNVLDSCLAIDDALTMSFVERGKLFAPAPYANLPELTSDYSKTIVDILSSKKLTYNFHRKCLSDEGLKRANLTDFYRPLAYSSDENGVKFIAIFEAIRYPFYGVQFHPEKPPFEFVTRPKQGNIPHSREAIAVSRFFADFFVQQARMNDHQVDRSLIEGHLIYAHKPMYTAPLKDMYEQRYLFPFGSDLGASTEEFIEHLPDPDEEAPEDVSDHSASGLVVDLPISIKDLPNASEDLPQRDFYILNTTTGIV